MINNKRGVSPLIATVLIIGFTVALAAIIITWGGGFIQKTQEDVSTKTDFALTCSNLNFRIASVACGSGADCSSIACPAGQTCSASDVCIDDLNSVTVSSNTDVTISGLLVRVTDDAGTVKVFDSEAATPTLDDDGNPITLVPFGAVEADLLDAAGAATSVANPDDIEVFAMIDSAEGEPTPCQAGEQTYFIGADDFCTSL